MLPGSGRLFVSVKDTDKPVILPGVRLLIELGFTIVATGGTADYLAGEGIAVERVNKVAQGRPHIVDRILDGDIALIFNTTEGWQSLKDSSDIRRSALNLKIPYFTTAQASVAAARGDRGAVEAQPGCAAAPGFLRLARLIRLTAPRSSAGVPDGLFELRPEHQLS